MLKIPRSRCLVVCCCTWQKTRVMNISYSVQEEEFTDNKPDHFGSGLILENKQAFKQELGTDTGQYIPRDLLPGQRLEDVILDDPLLTIPLGISTQLTNGRTTETLITAFEDERPVNVYIRFLYDSFITNLETQNE